MLAFVYDVEGQCALRTVNDPGCPDGGAVLRVTATSICGTDLRTFRHGSTRISPPRIIGHEVVGRLVSVGRSLGGFSVGDKVQVAPAIGCGTCRPCMHGRTNLCDALETIGFQHDGTFAELMEIPPKAFQMGNVTLLPDGVREAEAVLAEPIACVQNAQSQLSIGEGDRVAIFGAGFIGCMHAELAARKGASPIFLIEPNARRRAMACTILPELVALDPVRGSTARQVGDLTDGSGVDVAITACSSGDAQRDALAVCAKSGRVSLFGGLPAGKPSTGYIDSNLIHYREISVHGVHASTPAQNRQVLQLIASGGLSVTPFTRDLFPLEKIEEAFREIADERIMKAVILPNG